MLISNLFQDMSPPPVRLIESFSVLGLSAQTLRSICYLETLLKGDVQIEPEVLSKYPPWTNSVPESTLKVNKI